MTATCETPATESKRGRRVQSASVRSFERGLPGGGEADYHHLSENGGLRAEGGLSCRGGQQFGYRGESFGDYLTGDVDVGIPVELHPYHGEARGGLRTDAAHVRCAVERSLYRKGHESFHLFGGHSLCLGHDYHGGGVEVGEYVHFHARGGPYAGDGDEDRRDNHHQAVIEREPDYPVQHGRAELVGMSVGNGVRCGGHLHIDGAAGDDAFASLQSAQDFDVHSVVAAAPYLLAAVTVGVER